MNLVLPNYRLRNTRWATYPGLTAYTTSVAPHASNNTKSSSWAELISSTPFEADALFLQPVGNSAWLEFLFDLAIGGAGSEVIFLNNLHLSAGNDQWNPCPFLIPLHMPEGSRISAKSQCNVGGSGAGMALSLWNSGYPHFRGIGPIDTYGADTSDSGGLVIDPGGSANTKGSWVEFTSSLTNRARMCWVALGMRANTDPSSSPFMLDVGIGTAGSESVYIPDLYFKTLGAFDSISPQYFGPYVVDWPAGTRVAMRTASTLTDATDRLVDAVLYTAR